MTTSLSMIPLAKIRPSDGNPRTVFDDERMAELIDSVKRHGIITPLTLSHDGDGRYAIIAGERRYRAAKAAKLREVPAQIREADGATLTLAVAENVIRADLSPMEEACAYRRLADEHGDAAKVAKLVGKSERLISDRLDLLRLPDETAQLIAARRVPLACAPLLVRIAEHEPLLADLAALWLSERPRDAAAFPTAPGEVLDDVLRAEWADDGQPVYPVAYSVGGFRGPLTPPAEDRLAAVLAKLRDHAQTVEDTYRALPAIPQASEHDWQARQTEERRERDCFALTDDDADAARAFGCLLELPGHNGREHRYVTDPAWLADRLVQRIVAHVAEEAEREEQRDARIPSASQDDGAKEERRRERERQYDARGSARSRNLDLGAALARWQPKLDADAIKLLGQIVLEQHGRAAAWAHRLCVDQPATTNKQGRETVRYPRGADAEREHHAEALAALRRTRTPEDALAVVLRLLVAQRLADTDGLPNADRQGIYEPELLASSELLGKLARRVAPASVRRHHAEQQTSDPREDTEEALDEAA